MKKKSKTAPKIDPLLEGMMSKLLDRLVSLEKKMDTVLSRIGKGGQGPAAQAPPPPARHERMMYEAICADCSKVCEVPFRPSEDRKVYCKACWARRKGQHPGMPVLTPVSLPPKPVGKLAQPVAAPQAPLKKAKKSKPAKKTKKR
jgi:CxxC-x17-CxxC domain-containing protein